jgi:hypothetical protein
LMYTGYRMTVLVYSISMSVYLFLPVSGVGVDYGSLTGWLAAW